MALIWKGETVPHIWSEQRQLAPTNSLRRCLFPLMTPFSSAGVVHPLPSRLASSRGQPVKHRRLSTGCESVSTLIEPCDSYTNSFVKSVAPSCSIFRTMHPRWASRSRSSAPLRMRRQTLSVGVPRFPPPPLSFRQCRQVVKTERSLRIARQKFRPNTMRDVRIL